MAAEPAIGIYGCNGRMGRAVAELLADFGARLAGGADASGDPAPVAAAADVLVDFSTPAALQANLDAARAARTPIVVGTTGLTGAHHDLIGQAAADIAVLQTGNTSLGVTLLAALVREAAAEGRGEALASDSVVGRAGLTGRRVEGTIGFASLRGGTVAGDHQVVFAGDGERIELGHRAESRTIFARGAIRAALWLAGKPAGRYTMAEVLGL